MSDAVPASSTATAEKSTATGTAAPAATGGQAAGAGTGSGAPAGAAGAAAATGAQGAPAVGAQGAAAGAPAAGEAAKPAEGAAAAAPKRLISFAEGEAKPGEQAKPGEAAAAQPQDWKLDRAKDSPLTQAEFDAMHAKAKALNLSKDQASAIIQERSAFQAAETARINDQWHGEAMADPEIGGAKMPQTIANVQKVLSTYATPAERKAIADSPFANNPFFLRFCNRIAAAMPAEDTVHTGKPPAGGKQYPRNPAEAARAMYPGKGAKA